VKLVEQTLQARFVRRVPRKLIGDRAYDSAILAKELQRRRIELVCPIRDGTSARRKSTARSQDGRTLRRYRKRWRIERLFAWLLRFRRLVTRWEPKAENFLGFLQLGCIKILLRRL
jgi:IS4 transposase